MSDKSKIQTTEQKFRKMLKEEKMVVDLELKLPKTQNGDYMMCLSITFVITKY